MNKTELIEKLQESQESEEEIILQLNNFVRTLLIQKANLFTSEKKEILQLYKILIQDSKKHYKKLTLLKNVIENSPKDGF